MRIATGFEDADRPAIAALYWEAFGGKLGRVMGPRERALRFIAPVLSPSHAICAHDGAGRLLGLAGFKTADGSLVDGGWGDMVAAYGGVGAAWRVAALSMLERDVDDVRFLMDGIVVAADVRGRGVGSRLLEAICAEARMRGYRDVRLDVIDGNRRARALYERRGFVAVEEQSMGPLRHVFGFRSATVMVRRLA